MALTRIKYVALQWEKLMSRILVSNTTFEEIGNILETPERAAFETTLANLSARGEFAAPAAGIGVGTFTGYVGFVGHQNHHKQWVIGKVRATAQGLDIALERRRQRRENDNAKKRASSVGAAEAAVQPDQDGAEEEKEGEAEAGEAEAAVQPDQDGAEEEKEGEAEAGEAEAGVQPDQDGAEEEKEGEAKAGEAEAGVQPDQDGAEEEKEEEEEEEAVFQPDQDGVEEEHVPVIASADDIAAAVSIVGNQIRVDVSRISYATLQAAMANYHAAGVFA
jgi:hypothetical protein